MNEPAVPAPEHQAEIDAREKYAYEIYPDEDADKYKDGIEHWRRMAMTHFFAGSQYARIELQKLVWNEAIEAVLEICTTGINADDALMRKTAKRIRGLKR